MKCVCRAFNGDAVHQFIEGLPGAVQEVQMPSLSSVAWFVTKFMTNVIMMRRPLLASESTVLHHIQRAKALAGSSEVSGEIIDAAVFKEIMLKLPKTNPWDIPQAAELFRSLQLLVESDDEDASAKPTG